MPFKAQEVRDQGGVYYGQNVDFSLADSRRSPMSCSHRDSRNSDFSTTGFSPSPYLLVVLDSVFNRIIRNRALGRNTWVYIDEIYLLFQHEYSANFLFTLWKRVRKYGACCTGLTQNVDDLLQSHTARTMLANSEFLVMLNQAATDRAELARLLNI